MMLILKSLTKFSDYVFKKSLIYGRASENLKCFITNIMVILTMNKNFEGKIIVRKFFCIQ